MHKNELEAKSQQNTLHLLAQASEQVLIRDAINEKHTNAITAFIFENERLVKSPSRICQFNPRCINKFVLPQQEHVGS